MKNEGIKQGMFLSLLCLAAIQMSTMASPALTYQKWTFDNSGNPASPEIDNNDYGLASAAITATGNTWGNGWLTSVMGRNGVWVGDTIVVDLTIPNNPVPNWYKEVWIEVGCRGHLYNEPYTGTGFSLGEGYEVLAPLGSVIEDLGYSVEKTYVYFGGQPYEDGWFKLVFGLRIYPNPDSETVRFTLLDSGADVDYIIVNTECVPEPMTIVLLGLGGLFCTKMKRK
jgi:hypothetical protein